MKAKLTMGSELKNVPLSFCFMSEETLFEEFLSKLKSQNLLNGPRSGIFLKRSGL